MRSPWHSRLAVVLLMATAVPVAARAQQADSTGAEEIRIACERERQTLSREASGVEKVKSMVAMQECGNAGVKTLVTYWQRQTTDTILLPALADASARINDRRTYQAARAVVVDPSRSESFRLAALTVLVAGVDRRIAVTFPKPTKPMSTSYVGLGRNFHPSTRKAPQPVGAEARPDVLSILRKLAASDPNERIRKVAAELGPLLKRF